MTFTYRNGVSAAECIVYIPCLAIAVLLSIRHGFGRNAGWIFLIIFCLARIIGPCMQLATISQPDNRSLYTGSAILQNVGVSPLQLATLGLLSRLLDSINKFKHTFMNTSMLRIVQIIITIGLILGIVGGINASDDLVKTGVYRPGTLSKAGTALLVVSYVAIVVATIATSFSTRHAEAGEKRIFFAVATSLPLMAVRLIYSILSTFSHNKHFNALTGDVTVLICVALVEEFFIVIIFLIVGLTLHKTPEIPQGERYEEPRAYPSNRPSQSRQNGGGNIAMKIAKKTIIGRLVTR